MENYSRSAGNNDWLTTLASMAPSLNPCVLVTIVKTQGSAPREAGCKMLVLADRCVGTIGGGHLELKVIEQSREWLTDSGPSSKIVRLPLGPSLGQCCGGQVTVLFERLTPQNTPWLETVIKLHTDGSQAVMVSKLAGDDSTNVVDNSATKLVVTPHDSVGSLRDTGLDNAAIDTARSMLCETTLPTTRWQDNLLFDPLHTEQFQVMLFGAGHVGKALINIMQSLPCGISWIDSRAEMFANQSPAPNVRIVISDDPADEIKSAPSNCYVIVMTHNHQLDLEICEHALQNSNIKFCGLIGSLTKRQRFLRRLAARGVSRDALQSLICPIGLPGVSDKHPALIAVSVVAQLLQTVEHNNLQLHNSVNYTDKIADPLL